MAEALKDWYVEGLQALTSANEIGKKGAEEGTYESKNEEVAALAKTSAEMQERHAQVIDQLLQSAGAKPAGRDNPAMTGIYQAINQMIDGADEEVKDAAAIAGAQIAFHYYIAAYGSLASDAKHAGEDEAAAKIIGILDEVKAQDEKYTATAENLANQEAAAA
jgi:ferritin-like metal-binding protein YciE